MERHAVQIYLEAHIPLSRAMGTRVLEADGDHVLLEAPLEPNLNHRGTGFGGSVATLAILAGWTLVHLRLRAEGVDARTVIQRSDVAYRRPVRDAFQARVVAPDQGTWDRFRRALRRFGKGRVPLRVQVLCDGGVVAEMEADYVSEAASA